MRVLHHAAMLIVLCTIASVAQVPTAGLVGYYPFDGSAADAGGLGNDGEVLGATVTSDRYGNDAGAYFFSGGTEVALPNVFGSPSMSFTAWICTSPGPVTRQVFTMYVDNTHCLSLMQTWRDDNIGLWVRNGGYDFQWSINSGAGTAPLEQWHFVCFTLDAASDDAILYVDGIPRGRAKMNGYTAANLGTITHTSIGHAYYASYQPDDAYDGKVDDVRIYDRALLDSEILSLFGTGNVEPGAIAGTIRYSGVPQSGVSIRLFQLTEGWVSGYTSTVTDAGGEFSCDQLSPGSYEVVAVEPEGKSTIQNPQYITVSSGGTTIVDFELTESSDDECFFYIANNGTEIWKSSLDGTNRSLVLGPFTGGPYANHVDFDRTSRRLAYTIYEPYGSLWVVNSDGSDNREIADVSWIHSVNWLNSNEISCCDVSGNLLRFNVSTGESRVWVPVSNFSSYGLNTFRDAFRWSADGRRFVCNVGQGGGGAQTAFSGDFDLGSGRISNLVQLSPIGSGWTDVSTSIDISSDGTMASYTWRYNGGPATRIYRLGTDGMEENQIGETQWHTFIRLSPDGTRLWFTDKKTDGTYGIFSVRTDGSDRQEIINSSESLSDFDFGLSPRSTVAVTGTIWAEDVGVANISVVLITPDGQPVANVDPVVSDETGNYAFAPIGVGDYQVLISEPPGYRADHNPKPVIMGSANTAVVNFELVRTSGSIAGMVIASGQGMAGVTVTILDQAGLPVPGCESQFTDAAGHFRFETIPTGNYQVMLVEPLGYAAGENPKEVSVAADQTAEVTFTIMFTVLADQAEKWSYWKNQFDKVVADKKTEETAQSLTSYISAIQTHYTPHFDCFAFTAFDQWQQVLSKPTRPSKRDLALAEVAALVLNIGSLKLGQHTMITEDGRTAGDVLTYVSNVVVDPMSTDEQLDAAKKVAAKANHGDNQVIKAGEVPAGNVVYKGGKRGIEWGFGTPIAYALEQNFPNPFNPTTTVQYDLPREGHVSLKVHDFLGREVATIVFGHQSAGRYEATFDASSLASGMYLLQLRAGEFVQTRRMVLIR